MRRTLLFWISLIVSVLAQNSTDDDNSTLIEDLETVEKTVKPFKLLLSEKKVAKGTKGREETVPILACGNPTDTEVCHFEGTVIVCDVCAGIQCTHGKKCEKMPGTCQPDCVCDRFGEVPDENGICRGACRPNPCHNNGSCMASGHSFHCDCPAGYDGERCQNVRNVCLDPHPPLCPTGNYECVLKGVNSYSCTCARGYWKNQDNHCVKVSHKAKLEIHFTETPYSETFNDPSAREYRLAREYIKAPFEIVFGQRLVAVEFRNFTQGSLVANLDVYLKSAENKTQADDEDLFWKHIMQCASSPVSAQCFGSLGRVYLPLNAWESQDERCENVACPEGTRCEPIDDEGDETRCVCSDGYEGYGSTVDNQGIVVELCKDVNECETILNACGEDEKCVNRRGGFECTAPCDNVKCPGYSECVLNEEGTFECRCSWIYAGSACSFPWTLIFLVTTGLLLLTTVISGFLLWRFGGSFSGGSKGKYNVFAVSSRLTSVRPTAEPLR